MIRTLQLLIVISFLVSTSQEQTLNGININAPKGFVKAGDLHWSHGNENIMISSFKGSVDSTEGKSYCEKGSRASQFVDYLNLEVNGLTYGFCLQKGSNTLAIISAMVYRDGYTYNVMVSAEPDDYKRGFEIMGYMITRLNKF